MNTLLTKQLFKPAKKARLRPFDAVFRHENDCSRRIYCLSSYKNNSKLVKGRENQIAHPIYLPPLLTSEAKTVGGNQDVILKIPGIEGFAMKVKANSVTFPDGSRIGTLVVSPVTADKLPMAPPAGGAQFGVPAWTVQPAGTRFDPPIEVTLPNASSQPPSDNLPIVQWDHDLGQYVPMGRATVSEDGSVLITDSGSGITKAGWGGLCRYDPDKCGQKAPPKCTSCEKTDTSGECPSCAADAAKNKTVCFSEDGRFCGKCADGYCDIRGEGQKMHEPSCCGGEKGDSDKCCIENENQTGKWKQVDKKTSIVGLGISNYQVCKNRKQGKSASKGAYVCSPISPDNGGVMNRQGVFFPLGDSTNSPHCIDGCSTPTAAAQALFIVSLTQSPDTQDPTMGLGDAGPTSFYPACAAHDQCYQTCNGLGKSTCDDNMLFAMQSACENAPVQTITKIVITPTGAQAVFISAKEACRSNADIYRLGLQAAGGAYKERKQQFCDCCGD